MNNPLQMDHRLNIIGKTIKLQEGKIFFGGYSLTQGDKVFLNRYKCTNHNGKN